MRTQAVLRDCFLASDVHNEQCQYAGVMADSSGANLAVNASPEEPACFAPGDQGLLGLRLGGLFGVLAFSTLGVVIPFFAYKTRLRPLFFLIRAFAAGVVLTTG